MVAGLKPGDRPVLPNSSHRRISVNLIPMRFIPFLFLGLSISLNGLAQDTTAIPKPVVPTAAATTPADTSSANDLLAGLADEESSQPLLPHKMLAPQRVFWGPKGLLRVIKVAPLTAESRQKELKVRRTMLISHQVAGFVTLAGYVVQGYLGAKLYNAEGNDYVRLYDAHKRSATYINISYATTAVLAFTAPPPLVAERRGLSSIRLHKYLSIIHLTGMIATNVLANSIQKNPELKPYHRAAAYTTFGAFAASIIVLRFN